MKENSPNKSEPLDPNSQRAKNLSVECDPITGEPPFKMAFYKALRESQQRKSPPGAVDEPPPSQV